MAAAARGRLDLPGRRPSRRLPARSWHDLHWPSPGRSSVGVPPRQLSASRRCLRLNPSHSINPLPVGAMRRPPKRFTTAHSSTSSCGLPMPPTSIPTRPTTRPVFLDFCASRSPNLTSPWVLWRRCDLGSAAGPIRWGWPSLWSSSRCRRALAGGAAANSAIGGTCSPNRQTMLDKPGRL